ncbi:MAG: recombinase family protein [Alphaproteobacteria bacterium]|nr:recombinase family protein [Alphaproteobacteria bacterium]
MSRVAIYARYSSDHQRDASIEDQIAVCRRYAERQGWTVVDWYADRAISGSSLLRPGIQSLMEDAGKGGFDVVLAEALDRLSRDQEDVAGVFKRLSFAGVKIITLSEGEISHLHVGLKGTMNALFLKDLADKTRRGLQGRIETGKSAGGLCYGYDVVKKYNEDGELIRGDRTINEAEATVVRRIFKAFAAGQSPRQLAKALNADGVPGPQGKVWTDTTIRGHATRGTGLLNNELYVGRLVWNRLRYIKDPDTGKRVSRPNPKSDWVVQRVPELRIIEDDLWEQVKERQAAILAKFETTPGRNRLNHTHRKKFLLSGLLSCSECEGSYTIRGQDRYGCFNHYNRGTCTNNRTIKRQIIEARVIAGLKDKLLAPDLAAEFVKGFQEETNALNHDRELATVQDKAALAKAERSIKAILDAIEDGRYQRSMLDRLDELEKQKDQIGARLAKAPPPLPRIHPNVAEIYRVKIQRLEDALRRPDDAREAAEAMRSLIDKIVLTPGKKRGEVKAELYGELAAILALASGQKLRLDKEDDVISVLRNTSFRN